MNQAAVGEGGCAAAAWAERRSPHLGQVALPGLALGVPAVTRQGATSGLTPLPPRLFPCGQDSGRREVPLRFPPPPPESPVPAQPAWLV